MREFFGRRWVKITLTVCAIITVTILHFVKEATHWPILEFFNL